MPAQYTTAPVTYIKDIRRNAATKDWDVYIQYLDTGRTEYLGSAATRRAAESLADEHMYRLCRAGVL